MKKQYDKPESILLEANIPSLLAGSPTIKDEPSNTGDWNLSKKSFNNLIEDDSEDID